MDKGSIQKFAVGARVELIEAVKLRAYWYGVTAEGCGELDTTAVNGKPLTPAERDQRAALVREVERNGYPQVMEEAAYTWFNRFIALRFLEVNGYLPSRVRVFSDPEGRSRPEILTTALEVELPGLDREYIEGCIRENRTEELYRYLLLCQCNALHDALPVMFERVENWTELLLPDHLLKEGGVLARLVSDIPEEDWTDQVQILGWLYQYYNTEVKAETFALLKKNVKITRERIPSATQLFTPDWIVRYMVENSLGRLWLEGHPGGELRAGWRYYLDEAEQEPEVAAQLEALRKNYAKMSPQDIKVIDPCCGSGHILVYAFDVFIEIYKSQGIRERDAAAMILENNLYGLDIDPRAAQLAWFAVMMKARQYDRQIFQKPAKPQVYSPKGYPEGEEFGSLLTVENLEPEPETVSMYEDDNYNRWRFRRALAGRYDVVVTNPPYGGSGNMRDNLLGYMKENYPDQKADLFSCFIERGNLLAKKNGYNCMVTMQSWMFLSSFEKMRQKLLQTKTITTLMHMENMVMGIAFGTAVTIFRNSHISGYKGTYNQIKMADIEKCTVDGKEVERPQGFPVPGNRFAQTSAGNFVKIPGAPVAYWVSGNVYNAFFNGTSLEKYAEPRQGVKTLDNDRFLRFWSEIPYEHICFNAKNQHEATASKKRWFPYNKGGEYRRWYGNNYYVVNWENDGCEMKKLAIEKYGCVTRTVTNIAYFYKPGLTWSALSSGAFSIRWFNEGFIFDSKGSSMYFDTEEEREYIIGLMNSNVASYLLNILAPTLDFNVGPMKKLPVIMIAQKQRTISEVVKKCIESCEMDWNFFEISWDFRRHPLI